MQIYLEKHLKDIDTLSIREGDTIKLTLPSLNIDCNKMGIL